MIKYEIFPELLDNMLAKQIRFHLYSSYFFFPVPIHGYFSDWDDWSECSASCGEGQQIRTRTCTNPAPAFGGKDCNGAHQEIQSCTVANCPGEKTKYAYDTPMLHC